MFVDCYTAVNAWLMIMCEALPRKLLGGLSEATRRFFVVSRVIVWWLVVADKTRYIGRRPSVSEWSRCMRLRVTRVISITHQTRSFWQRICTVNIAYLGVRQLLRQRRLPCGTISLKWTLLRPLPSIYDYVPRRMKISDIVIGAKELNRWI